MILQQWELNGITNSDVHKMMLSRYCQACQWMACDGTSTCLHMPVFI